MPKLKNEWLANPAPDWNQTTTYHGFSRQAASQTYLVTLSCLGTQYQISFHKDQLEAARAYDAALSILLPFAPPRARPNFPKDFAAVSLDDVKTLCPYAIELFNTLSERVRASGMSVDALKAARESNLKVALEVPAVDNSRKGRAVRSYDNLTHRVAASMADSRESATRLNAKALATDLRKLPTVNLAVQQATAKLEEASLALLEAHQLLQSQRDYYVKINSEIIE